MSDHALLAPSSAHIWAPPDGCPGSARMQALYPEPEDSPDAIEGTAAHYYVSEILNEREPFVGMVAPNGHPITAEMVDCAQSILIDVRDVMRSWPGAELWVERRVFMPIVHADNWGTLDVAVIDRANRRAYLWDYKFGHRFVDAAGNWQLLDYAIGVLRELAPCAEWPQWSLTLSVAQPRNFHPIGPIREWRVDGATLLDTYVPKFYEAARLATAENPPLRTNDHCRDCTARRACPALQRAGAIAMDVSLHAQPVELPPHAVGLELRQIDDAIRRLEARQTGLEEQALGLIRGGTAVPFYSAQHASGRETWNVPLDQVFALGDNFGVDLRKPAAITPGQARKAGIDATVITAYAEKPRGALRLERVNDDAAKLAFS
jgi:hypothetical protein